MNFTDYSPSTSPTVDQQRDSLRKGLGRALQWARASNLAEEPLLDACLHDLRFDCSVDERRGAWLWQILTTMHLESRYREKILDALRKLPVENDGEQLCDLAFQFASQRDEPFRTRLYEIVEQKPFREEPWLGEEQIIALDNESGLLFAIRVRGAQLSVRDWEWHDRHLVMQAVEQLGEGRVLKALHSIDDKQGQRFRETWLLHRDAKSASIQSRHARMRAIRVDEIIDAAETTGVEFPNFRGWGMRAEPRDLETVFGRLLSATEPKVIVRYLTVFSNRAVPRMHPRLLALCQHDDASVRRRALGALAQNADPRVRELALARMDSGIDDSRVVSLFIKNYQENDERRLLESLQLPEDLSNRHWLLMETVKVLEANPQSDCSELGQIAYSLTPCASCRSHAARLLHKRKVAPQWLREECRHDSEADTRKLAETTIEAAESDS